MTTKQETRDKALVLLAQGYTRIEVAETLGINLRTLYRWEETKPTKKQPSFKVEIEDHKREVYQAALAVLIDGAREAAYILRGIISDPETPKAIKIRAINSLLSHCAEYQNSDSDLIKAVNLLQNSGVLSFEISQSIKSKLDNLAGTVRESFELRSAEVANREEIIELMRSAVIGS